jgi:group II intron reverse transcriptase/maturase
MVDVICELGHLEKLAKEDPTRRFNRLYRLLRQESFLALARQRIAHNKGANTPGVDGQVMDDITPQEIFRLSQELAAGTYQPQPAQRRYIPKRNGKLRPLGIAASRDKVVQAGVALILEALYEPLFGSCSHGFRPGHSPITALRQASAAYRAGATWIIEGDISDCFGSFPHSVILNCLRKRIRDERFIDLVRKMLQAGVMESGRTTPTYSGTAQGDVASPILANIVLHEFDRWMETTWQVNPPPLTAKEQNARSNPAYMRLHYRIMDLRRYLDGKRPMPKGKTAEALRQELREKLRLRRLQPRLLPRRAIYYLRYADDFLVILCNTSKEEARQLKASMAAWLHETLGLTLNQDKTLVTHWTKQLRFLGYHLQGRANRNGTHWLYLSIPKTAVREVVAKVERATAYSQAPAYDVFVNVNRVVRGWTNYYRYAHNNNAVGGKLSMVVYWRTVHYLAKKHRRSIARIMRKQYGRDLKTGCLALFVHKPGVSPSPKTRYFLWHKTPHRLTFASAGAASVKDRQAYVDLGWVRGHSLHKRLETRAQARLTCACCGATGVTLFVHHPNRLRKAKRVKKGARHVAASGLEQQTVLLCRACHLGYHHGNTRQ